MKQEAFFSFLEQGSLAALITRLESNGLMCLVHFEAGACASSHDSVEALKGSLRKAWDKIPQETLRKAIDSRRRLERVIQAIEKNIY